MKIDERRAGFAPSPSRSEGRQLLLFSTLLGLMETILASALAPLIPELTRAYGLSTARVGLLFAAYPAGMVLVSIPAGYWAASFGPRRTAVAGIWLLSISSVAFAFARSPAELDLGRFFQGVGATTAWAGALAWLARAYAVEERGRAIGVAVSAAFVGVLLGPGLGAIAASAGLQVIFCAIGIGLGLVAVWGGPRHQAVARSSATPASIRAFGGPPLLLCIAFAIVLGVISGTTSALGPLLLSGRGLSSAAIAGCFVAAAAPQVLITPALGRRLGRSGLQHFCAATMLATAAVLPLVVIKSGQVVSACLFGLAVAVGFMGSNPMMLLLSATAERMGASQEMAMSLGNGAWGLGAAAGALALGTVADATSISAAFLIASALALVMALCLAIPRTIGTSRPLVTPSQQEL